MVGRTTAIGHGAWRTTAELGLERRTQATVLATRLRKPSPSNKE
ncbi:hypothetical protein AB0425_15325 [Actinosynnema sp. NPDC051121]